MRNYHHRGLGHARNLVSEQRATSHFCLIRLIRLSVLRGAIFHDTFIFFATFARKLEAGIQGDPLSSSGPSTCSAGHPTQLAPGRPEAQNYTPNSRSTAIERPLCFLYVYCICSTGSALPCRLARPSDKHQGLHRYWVTKSQAIQMNFSSCAAKPSDQHQSKAIEY